MSKYEELFPIIEMFKNKNLIVENIDGSIEYRDGDIDGIYFEGIDAFHLNIEELFLQINILRIFSTFGKEIVIETCKKNIEKNQNDKNGEKN